MLSTALFNLLYNSTFLHLDVASFLISVQIGALPKSVVDRVNKISTIGLHICICMYIYMYITKHHNLIINNIHRTLFT